MSFRQNTLSFADAYGTSIVIIILSIYTMVLGSIAVAGFDTHPQSEQMKKDYKIRYEFSATGVGLGVAGLLIGGYSIYSAFRK